MRIGLQSSPVLSSPSTAPARAALATPPSGETFEASRADELRQAMSELKAAANRPYYDETGDAAKREKYYQDIPADASPAQLFSALSKKVSSTHTKPQSYKPRRYSINSNILLIVNMMKKMRSAGAIVARMPSVLPIA